MMVCAGAAGSCHAAAAHGRERGNAGGRHAAAAHGRGVYMMVCAGAAG